MSRPCRNGEQAKESLVTCLGLLSVNAAENPEHAPTYIVTLGLDFELSATVPVYLRMQVLLCCSNGLGVSRLQVGNY